LTFPTNEDQFLEGETTGSKYSPASAAAVLAKREDVTKNWKAKFTCTEQNVKKYFTKWTNDKKQAQKQSAKTEAESTAASGLGVDVGRKGKRKKSTTTTTTTTTSNATTAVSRGNVASEELVEVELVERLGLDSVASEQLDAPLFFAM